MTEKERSSVFVRESTGLVKNVSMLDAIALNVSNMSAGAALATIGFTMVALPSVAGVNLVYASLIAFILSIPQIVVYTMIRLGGFHAPEETTSGSLGPTAASSAARSGSWAIPSKRSLTLP